MNTIKPLSQALTLDTQDNAAKPVLNGWLGHLHRQMMAWPQKARFASDPLSCQLLVL